MSEVRFAEARGALVWPLQAARVLVGSVLLQALTGLQDASAQEARADVAVQRDQPATRGTQSPALNAFKTYSIASGDLSQSLDRFSRQSGWQIAYDIQELKAFRAPALRGRFTAAQALDRLLRGTPLVWQLVSETVVVKTALTSAAPTQPRNAEVVETHPVPANGETTFSDLHVYEDAWRTPGNAMSGAAFGFEKPLLETPRSISIIDDDTIEVFDLSAVEDLVRVVPGVYTTTRFGIQGSVDIRNVPADTYFRGMKRLTLQGHGRSVLAAM
ncbi:MAG TPA: secretin and TonB N-terminal domain-containing protein, partial [Steroidobacteraceae bacterium]|nr:secretin and TonB N-terminal domain-containing protein [Steroidobacteraceae bacterium]